MEKPTEGIELWCPGWRSGPIRLAITPRERRRGLRPVPSGFGLLLRTRSVHGAGMRRALWAISLDRSGIVRGVRFLEPGRVAIDLGAAWFLELPEERVPPRRASRLEPRRSTLP